MRENNLQLLIHLFFIHRMLLNLHSATGTFNTSDQVQPAVDKKGESAKGFSCNSQGSIAFQRDQLYINTILGLY